MTYFSKSLIFLAFFSVLCISSTELLSASEITDVDDNPVLSSLSLHKSKEQKILELVEEGEKNIASLAGSNIIVVIGNTGVGKSTTINYLLGASMCVAQDEKGAEFIDIVGSSRGRRPVIGHEKKACTVLPELYEIPGDPEDPDGSYAFLDTRGFGGKEMRPEQDIAVSILTEMAIKKARSVRIMVIGSYTDIAGKGRSFMDLGRILSKIIVKDRVPVFFMFNRYQTLTPQTFYRKSPSQQAQEINNSLIREINGIIDFEHNLLSTVAENIGNRLNQVWNRAMRLFGGENSPNEAIMRDQEFQKALTEASYTKILKYNLDLMNVGYVDPLSDNFESRLFIFDALKRLSPVNPGSLIFSGYNTDRAEFDNAFAHKIGPFLSLIKAKARMSKFSSPLLKTLADEARACFEYHSTRLRTLPTSMTAEQLQAIEGAYATRKADIEQQRLDQSNKKTRLIENREILRQDIIDLLRSVPKKIWDEKWCKECDEWWQFWREHESVYPLSTHFVRWEESLEEHTQRASAFYAREDSPYLRQFYNASMGKECAGEVRVYVRPADHPSTIELIADKEREIAAITREVDGCDSTMLLLNRDGLSAVKDRIAAKVRIFTEYESRIRKSNEVYATVDEHYRKYSEQIAVCARIADKLDTDQPIAKAFRDFYLDFQSIISQEKTELDERLLDKTFGVPLLDPVELHCPCGGHGERYERRKIVEWLERDGRCPVGRIPANKIIPMGSLEMEIFDVLDGVYSDALSAEQMLASINFSVL